VDTIILPVPDDGYFQFKAPLVYIEYMYPSSLPIYILLEDTTGDAYVFPPN
jgi:hypothetical protein